MLPIVWVLRVILSYCQQLCTLLAGLQLSTRWISSRSWSRCQEWCIKSNQHSLKTHGPIKMLVLKRRTIWSNVSAARHISALKVEKKLTLSAGILTNSVKKSLALEKCSNLVLFESFASCAPSAIHFSYTAHLRTGPNQHFLPLTYAKCWCTDVKDNSDPETEFNSGKIPYVWKPA